MDSKQYYLMNKNTAVLVVNKDKNSNKFHSIEEILDIDYAPL